MKDLQKLLEQRRKELGIKIYEKTPKNIENLTVEELNIIENIEKQKEIKKQVEIIENEKAPPNEEEKENNKNYILYDFNLRENYSTVETVIYCFFKRQYKISKLRDKDNKKYFSLTIEEIAKMTKENSRTVRRAIKKLVEDGCIEIKKGGINKNKYYIK